MTAAAVAYECVLSRVFFVRIRKCSSQDVQPTAPISVSDLLLYHIIHIICVYHFVPLETSSNNMTINTQKMCITFVQ